MSESALLVKALVKRIPGSVSLVRFARTLHKTAAESFAKAYISRLKYYFWRAIHFDNLTSRFAISDHTRENYLVYTSDKVIGKLLYCRGDFDFHKFERAMRIIKTDKPIETSAKKPVLFDVGANVGSIGIPAIKRGYVDRVVAFEPDPHNFRLLRINSILNDVDDKMKCYQVALGAESGKAELIRNMNYHGDHRIRDSSRNGEVTGTDHASIRSTVEVHKLDDFLSGATDSIVWIDVQGYETSVLSGATSALRKGWPLVLEFTPKDLIENGTMEQFVAHLTGSSYTHYYNLDSTDPVSIELNRENLLALGRELEELDSFTDILVL